MRRTPAVSALPEVLELVARELRAGRNLHEAVGAAAIDPATSVSGIGAVATAIAGGARLRDAIDRWAAALAHPDADVIRALMAVATDTSGAMADTVERAASTLRERAALHDEIGALTSQVRVSAVLLTAAPPAFLAVVTIGDPSALTLTLASGAGRAALGVGLVLDAVGLWWMRRLMARVERC